MLNPKGDIEDLYRDFAKNYPLKTDDSGWDEFLQKLENSPLKNLPSQKPGPGVRYTGFLKRYVYWLSTAAIIVVITGVLVLKNEKEGSQPNAVPVSQLKHAVPLPGNTPKQQVETQKGTAMPAGTAIRPPASVQKQTGNVKPEHKQKEAEIKTERLAADNQKTPPAVLPKNMQQPAAGISGKQVRAEGMANNITAKPGTGKQTGDTGGNLLKGNEQTVDIQGTAAGDKTPPAENNSNTAGPVDSLTSRNNLAKGIPGDSAVANENFLSKSASGITAGASLPLETGQPLVLNDSGRSDTVPFKQPFKPASTTENSIAPGTVTLNSSKPVTSANAEKHIGSVAATQPLVKISTRDKNYFYFGLVAGPDISTVKFQPVNNTGSNFGVLFGVYLGHNFSIESGLLAAAKKYYSSGAYFKNGFLPPPDWNDLKSVNVSGNFLEVPITLRYDLIHKKYYKIFINGGFSSYFTTNEKYRFLFQRPFGYQTGYEEADELSGNIFSIIHLSAGLEIKINAHNAFRFEPYIKLPLSGIGAGALPVTSTGLYINFTHSFF